MQIHYLELEESVEVAAVLAKAGVTTVAACADGVRNVTRRLSRRHRRRSVRCDAHAHAITQHYLYHEMNLKLPRKFKVGHLGQPRDKAQAMINDIGLFARVTDEGPASGSTSRVASARRPRSPTFGTTSFPSATCSRRAKPSCASYFRDGERKNRKKNRMKFLLRSVGEKEFLRRLDAEFEVVMREKRGAVAARGAGHAICTSTASRSPATRARRSARRRRLRPLEAHEHDRADTSRLPRGHHQASARRRSAEQLRIDCRAGAQVRQRHGTSHQPAEPGAALGSHA